MLAFRQSRLWSERTTLLLLLAAMATGALLRLYQIQGQILADDEWHALHAAITSDYGHILTHFGDADRSIPLTLLDRFLWLHSGISEMKMRLPMLLCGVAALLVVPWMIARQLGRGIAVLLAWLLALSPIHIYFSRYARPYSVTMLLASVGMISFYWWSTTGRRRWAAAYIVCAVVGPYFHLAALPVLLAPLVVAFLEILATGVTGVCSRKSLGVVASITGAGLAVLLVWPLAFDASTLAAKAARSGITTQTILGASQLLTGTSHAWLILVTVALVIAGAFSLYRLNRRFFLYLSTISILQAAVPFATKPDAIHVPIVFARYSLSVLPVALLVLSAGVVALQEWSSRYVPFLRRGVLGAALCLTLFWLGPLREISYRPNNWLNHAAFEYYYTYDDSNPYVQALRPKEISKFYLALGTEPAGAGRIVEAPWYYQWHNNPFPFYQQVHRRETFIGMTGDGEPLRKAELPLWLPGFRFRNFVHVSDLAGLRRRNVRYVIFHKNLSAEVHNQSPRELLDVSGWVRQYTRIHGNPVFEDGQIVVFAVSRRDP